VVYKQLANTLNQRMNKVFTNLTTWVLIAIISGALLGYIAPATAVKMQVVFADPD
jgi:Na+/H+-dicarboxylate symporter